MNNDRHDAIYTAIVVAVCVVFIAVVWAFIAHRNQQCRERGGVYLMGSYKCVSGIEEV